MRLLLALLALVGLLMTPVAASAGAAFCFGHMEGAAVAMAAASDEAAAPTPADHGCCDPDEGAGGHDPQRCLQACAAMCVAPVVLADPPTLAVAPVGRALVEAAAPKAFHAHAPPALKRPPRTLA